MNGIVTPVYGSSTRTLLFCTSFATSKVEWRLRYGRWVERARRSGLRYDRLAIIDDGSPLMPSWAKLISADGHNAQRRRGWFDGPAPQIGAAEVHHFSDNLGRRTTLDFPGWYRSFAHSTVLAREMGATKIVHIESDAALLSREMVDYIDAFSDGWMSPYSAMYGFPEMAIQVVAGTSVARYLELFSQPYDWLRDRIHETALPYTHVVERWVGDRYTGEAQVPRDSDFASQLPSEREDGFSWWDHGLGCSRPACAPEPGDNALFRIDFTPEGEAAKRCGFGWAAPEALFRWTVGDDSLVSLPKRRRAAALIIDMEPCLDRLLVPFQRVEVHLDGRELTRLKLTERCRVRVELPQGDTGEGLLRLHHPDAVVANILEPELADARRLAVRVFSMTGVAA